MFRFWRDIFILAALISLLAVSAFAGSGSFIGVEGESVSGTATVSARTVSLSDDFRSSRGPDLYVYLGNDKPSKIIAKLKKRSGAQSYSLPGDIKLSDYKAVFIHCKRFNHTFGKATLK